MFHFINIKKQHTPLLLFFSTAMELPFTNLDPPQRQLSKKSFVSDFERHCIHAMGIEQQNNTSSSVRKGSRFLNGFSETLPPIPVQGTEDTCKALRAQGGGIQADHPSLTIVLEREYSFLCTSKEGVFIGSPDSTTCVIVGARVTCRQYSGASVAIVHLNDPEPKAVSNALHAMLWDMAVPALLLSSERKEGEEKEPSKSIEVIVQWYVVGGMPSDISTKTMGLLLRFFSELNSPTTVPSFLSEAFGPISVQHQLQLDGVCFLSMNSLSGDRCALWGLVIEVATGKCAPLHIAPGTRNYPAAALRPAIAGYRAVAPLFSAKIPSVVRRMVTNPTLAKALGFKPQQGDGASPSVDAKESITFAQFVALQAKAIEENILTPIIVYRTNYAKMPVLKNSSEYLQMSTSPQCEPTDFAAILQRAAIFASLFSPKDVFGDSSLLFC